MATSEERGGFRGRIVDDYAGHKLYDERGEKIGKVEYTVLDSRGNPEYLAVKTGWFGSNTTLLPESLLHPGEGEFEVRASEDRIKDAPTFDNEDDVDSDFENRVREHFGVGGAGSSSASSSSTPGDAERRETGSRDTEYRDDESRESENRERRESRGDDRRAEGRSGDFDRDRDDLDRDLRDDRSRDDRSRDDRDAVAGGAAGAASGSVSRDSGREERRGSPETLGGEREKVRVMLKRERARAERVIGDDGREEVRIRKEMVEEEEMVEVEERV